MSRKRKLTAEEKKKPRGRPITRRIEIHATAEQIAKSIFWNAKPPDPSSASSEAQGLIVFLASILDNSLCKATVRG